MQTNGVSWHHVNVLVRLTFVGLWLVGAAACEQKAPQLDSTRAAGDSTAVRATQGRESQSFMPVTSVVARLTDRTRSELHHDAQFLRDCTQASGGHCPANEKFGPYAEVLAVGTASPDAVVGEFFPCTSDARLRHGCVIAIVQLFGKRDYPPLHLTGSDSAATPNFILMRGEPDAPGGWEARVFDESASASFDWNRGRKLSMRAVPISTSSEVAIWHWAGNTERQTIGVVCAAKYWCVVKRFSGLDSPPPASCPPGIDLPTCHVEGFTDRQRLSGTDDLETVGPTDGAIIPAATLQSGGFKQFLGAGGTAATLVMSSDYEMPTTATPHPVLKAGTPYELKYVLSDSTKAKDRNSWSVYLIDKANSYSLGHAITYREHPDDAGNVIPSPPTARWRVPRPSALHKTGGTSTGAWTKCGPGCCEVTLDM